MLYVFVWLTFLLIQTNADPVFECEPNFSPSTLDDKICYWVVTNATTFDVAEATCQSKGGHLATVSDQFTNTYIAFLATPYLTSSNHYWIGATRKITVPEGKIWTWTFDNRLLSFTDFDPRSTTTGDCVGVESNGQWEKLECETENVFVCESPAKINVCDDGWVYDEETHQCYRLFGKTNETNNFTQDNSENICAQHDGHLASIHNESGNIFVGKMAMIYNGGSHANIWIGLMQSSNGSLFWTDGSIVDFHHYQNPNSQSGKCIIFSPTIAISGNITGDWIWTACGTITDRFVCKKPPQKSVNFSHRFCDNGMVTYENFSICYDINENETTFNYAQSNCVSKGGYLASVLNLHENYFINVRANHTSNYWIGGKTFKTLADNTTVSVWAWDEYKWQLYMNFTNWGGSSSGNCTLSGIGALWSAVDCNDNYSYVCQIPAKIEVCDDGWTYYEGSHSCYGIFSSSPYFNEINQKTAENFCGTMGSHLTSIQDEHENSFIASIAAFESYPNLWIGLMQNTNASDWYWTDGSPVSFYQNFVGAANGTCVQLDASPWSGSVVGGWYTESCSDKIDRFICKKAPYRTSP